MRLRQSLLKSWSACPLQAKFAHLDGLPQEQGSKATFGTCIHAGLHQYELTGDVENAIKVFLHFWDSPEELGVGIDHWNRWTTAGGLRQKGIDILRAYDERNRHEPRQIIALEHKFLVPFGRHELTGTIDELELRRNHRGNDILRVVDFKTNAKRPNLGTLLLDLQGTVYVYATTQPEFWLGNGPDFPPMPNGEWWWETLQEVARRFIWVQLWDDAKEIDGGAREQLDFDRAYRLCNEIEHAIEAEVFVPTINGDSCTVCSYVNDPCPTKLPSRDEWEAARLEDDTAWV